MSSSRSSRSSSRSTRGRVEVTRSSGARPQSRETLTRIVPIASAKERADPRLQLLPDAELQRILESYNVDVSQIRRRDQLLTQIYSLSEIPTPFRKSYSLEDLVDLVFVEDIEGNPILETLNNTENMSIFEVLQREKVISPQLRLLFDQPFVFDLLEDTNLDRDQLLEEIKALNEDEKGMEPQYQRMTHAQLEEYFEAQALTRLELAEMNVPMVQAGKKKVPKTSPILELAFSGYPVSFFPASISESARTLYDMIFKESPPFLGTRELQESRQKLTTPARKFRIRSQAGPTTQKPKFADIVELPEWNLEEPFLDQIKLDLETLKAAEADIRQFLIRGNSFPVTLLPGLLLSTQTEYRDLMEFPPMKKQPRKRPVEWDIEEYTALNDLPTNVLIGLVGMMGFRLSEIEKLSRPTLIFILSRGELPPTLKMSDIVDTEVFLRRIIDSYPDPEMAKEAFLQYFSAKTLQEISNLRFSENGLTLFRRGAKEPEKVLEEIRAVPFPTEEDPHEALLHSLAFLRGWREYPAKKIPFSVDDPPKSAFEAYNWLLRSSDEKILDHFGVQPQYGNRGELIQQILDLLVEPGPVLVLNPEICETPLAFGVFGDWECVAKYDSRMVGLAEFTQE